MTVPDRRVAWKRSGNGGFECKRPDAQAPLRPGGVMTISREMLGTMTSRILAYNAQRR